MYIRRAQGWDVRHLAVQLADDDLEECKANYGTTEGLSQRLQAHLKSTSVVLTDALGTVYAYGGNQGDCVWFLTTKHTERLDLKGKIEFRNKIMMHRDWLLKDYPALWNYVWEGNKSHIRFLKSIGAKFHDDKWTRSPVTGEVFNLFTIQKEE
ncbi:DUF2833 domain-containing protein [Salmonella enterica subsp. enterica serovar Newport]|nr:DUF2833 domain-containing protein [Salmonella enterica subsp. enterica serovar Newport]